jgi:protein-disulfide isomerase
MAKKPTFLQILVLTTALAASVLIAVGAVYEASAPPQTSELLAEGRPRIGRLEAKIELVLIEDFRCGACRYFSEKIFPHIQKTYIDTGLAYCVIVPVSFLDGSEPLANAALAVYKLAPERLLPYMHALFDHFNGRESNGMEPKEVIEVAEKVGGIDVKRLRELVEANAFAMQLEKNLDWAQRIMGRNFGTPAFYVNGMKTSTSSIEAVIRRIEKLERDR